MADSPNPIPHVVDNGHVEIFHSLHEAGKFDLPKIPLFDEPKFAFIIGGAALLLVLLFVPLGRRARDGSVPRGRLQNLLETILEFIADQVAKPAIGEAEYKKFLPFLWTLFLFILTINLFGMLPFVASATSSIAVCVVLAGISFVVIHAAGIRAAHGPIAYLMSFKPHIEAGDGPALKFVGASISWGMLFLELLGAGIRGVVLAVRLFANMLAGHIVLFMLLAFIEMIGIAAAEGSDAANFLFWPVTTVSIAMVVAMSLLELFVACLQAFLFTFLTATFIGLAKHPAH